MRDNSRRERDDEQKNIPKQERRRLMAQSPAVPMSVDTIITLDWVGSGIWSFFFLFPFLFSEHTFDKRVGLVVFSFVIYTIDYEEPCLY